MRSFSKKLAAVLALAMVITTVPAAQAKAADDFTLNRTSATLFVNEGVNDKGKVEGLTGNVQAYDFNLKNKPADWNKDYKYTWASSDVKVATVDKVGIATAVGVGKAEITCTVTDKDGKTAATLKATVTVKANASDVEITNANDYDGKTVVANEVVDLNRAMYDENGNKTSKRGTYVTDYTRWVAEPSTGVVIDQATGKFTFTEEAVAGDYKLYCETYQSSTYNQSTAVSDVVLVTFEAEKTFDVKQTTTTKFTIMFNSPVKSLSTADVSVSRMLGNYPYNQVVKSVKLAEDKMSASVEIFNTFADKVNYTIKVKDYEDYTLTASNGKPVRMDVIAEDKNPSMVIYTNDATNLLCVFYDANDVVVSSDEKVRFTLDKTASTKDCYLSGNKLTIKKNTASAVVIASYPGWIENGKRVGDFTQTQAFFAEDKAPVVPVNVTDYTVIPGQFWGDNKSMQKSNTDKTLVVKLQQSDGLNYGTEHKAGQKFAGDGKLTITFTAMNPDICVVSNTGKLTAFKPGIASFYVNYKAYDTNLKKDVETPFAIVDVEVKADSYLSSVGVNNSNVKVGTNPSYDTAKVYILGYDQYNARKDAAATVSTSNFKIECLSEGYGDQTKLANILWAATNKSTVAYWGDGSGKKAIEIVVNANDLRDQLVKEDIITKADDGEFIDIEFRATYTEYGNKKSVDFTVTIQEPSGSADDNIIEIVTSDVTKDVLRKNEWNQNGEKKISFNINLMNNDVQVGVVPVAKFNSKAVSDGAYQFKILKDGEDITSHVNVAVTGSVVTVAPSYINGFADRVKNNVVSGGAVSYYGLGEGTYSLELYKWTKDNDTFVESLENTADIYVTVGDAGVYTLDGENQRANKVKVKDAIGNQYNADDAAAILKCFTIKDRDGNNIINPWDGSIATGRKYAKFYVDYTAPAGSSYVYVNEIVFYEEVGKGEYVDYHVAVDVALDRE